MVDYSVKGSSIRSKLEFVRERHGAAAVRELRADLELPEPLLDSSMYPFALYDAINRAIAERFLGGDLTRLREVGEYSAERVLGGVYRAYATGKDFVGFLRRAALLHERFYSHGRMEVEIDPSGDAARVDLLDAPEYSEADLEIAAGFYVGAAQRTGLQGVACDYELDGDGAHFTLDWRS